MGNTQTKSSFRSAIVLLNISADTIQLNDDKFWNKLWQEDSLVAGDIINSISLQEIRMLRDGSPRNFAALIYKMVEKLQYITTSTLCNTQSQQTATLNSVRILTRLIPCIFEDEKWRNFFQDNNINISKLQELKFQEKTEKNYLSYLPSGSKFIAKNEMSIDRNKSDRAEGKNSMMKAEDRVTELLDLNLLCLNEENAAPDNEKIESKEEKKYDLNDKKVGDNSLMKCLILSTCDLLFCPEFTVLTHGDKYLANAVDTPPEHLKSLPSCDYVWEPGVGFESKSNSTKYYDKSRVELLKLLLTSISMNLYQSPQESFNYKHVWMEILVSDENRHVLPLFTSLLNAIFIYQPASKVTPFNYLLADDSRQMLVELSIQLMIAALDYEFKDEKDGKSNLFIEYISRIHRDEDLNFLIKGFARLLNNCFEQNSLLMKNYRVKFDQELLILLWRISNLNSRFVPILLKTNDVLDIIVPILHHLNENFQDSSRSTIIQIGVFNLLVLSSERNLGVRLNKPYTNAILNNLPAFTGTYADLLIIVCHKLILYGYNLSQLFDHLITIVVNISPYLKFISPLSSKCLIQLFEIFSSPYVVFTEPNYHKLVIFLLEVFNNIIQYQFDGNTNLVYILLTKKETFLNLANLTSTSIGIEKVLRKLVKKKRRQMIMESMNDGQNSGELQSTNKPTQPMISRSKNISVPIPDVLQITKAIHPFDSKNSDLNSGSNANSIVYDHTEDESYPSISFDEILDYNSLENDDNDDQINLNSSIEARSDEATSDCDSGENTPLIQDDASSRQGVETEFKLGPNRWKPTPEWVQEWKKSLPLQTILRMIEVLTPQLERFRGERENSRPRDADLEAMKFLQNGTLVGLLPVPHPILTRKYCANRSMALWFKSCTWITIYFNNIMWKDSEIKLV